MIFLENNEYFSFHRQDDRVATASFTLSHWKVPFAPSNRQPICVLIRVMFVLIIQWQHGHDRRDIMSATKTIWKVAVAAMAWTIHGIIVHHNAMVVGTVHRPDVSTLLHIDLSPSLFLSIHSCPESSESRFSLHNCFTDFYRLSISLCLFPLQKWRSSSLIAVGTIVVIYTHICAQRKNILQMHTTKQNISLNRNLSIAHHHQRPPHTLGYRSNKTENSHTHATTCARHAQTHTRTRAQTTAYMHRTHQATCQSLAK